MRKHTLFFLLLLATQGGDFIHAQQNVGTHNAKRIVSPKVNAEKSVTFTLHAPNAGEVGIETSRGHIWSNRRSYLLEFIPQLFL